MGLNRFDLATILSIYRSSIYQTDIGASGRRKMDIRTVCLGLLTFDEASGYEIKKLFEDGTFAGVFDASYGSIYPALTRLAEEGFVDCREEAQSGRPDKKVYSITPAGRRYFVQELSGGVARDHIRSEFMIAMIFAHLLPSPVASGYVDERLAEYRRVIGFLRTSAAAPEVQISNLQFSMGLGIATLEARIAYIEANRHMIDRTTDSRLHKVAVQE